MLLDLINDTMKPAEA